MNNDKNMPIQSIRDMIRAFRDERDWEQFHHPKDLAEALSVEAAELLELFLWKNKEEVKAKIVNDPDYRERIAEELADVINYCLNMANVLEMDIYTIVKDKINKNALKYPLK